MAQKKRPYRKLQGFSFNIFSAPSLWIGPDHLLSVNAVLFQEQYQRFYYNDIQAIVMCRSNRHHAWTAIWCALALLSGLVAFFSSSTGSVSCVFLAIFSAALVANLVLGPACDACIQTAVQIQKLRSFRRMRNAGKAMDRIKTLAEQAQGPLDTDAFTTSATIPSTASPRSDTPHSSSTPSTQAVDVAGSFSLLPHRMLFGLLTVMGAIGVVQFGLKSLPLSVIETFMHATAQIMAIVALVRGYQPIKGTWLGRFSWISLVLIMLASVTGYILFITASTHYPELAYNNWALYKRCFEIVNGNTPYVLAVSLFFTVGYLLLGLVGLLATRHFSQD